MRLHRVAPFLFLATAACVAVPPELPEPDQNPAPTPAAMPSPTPTSTIEPPPNPGIPLPMPAAQLEGRFEQGGWIRGTVPIGTETMTVDGEPLGFDPDTGEFFIGLDRDAAPNMSLVFRGSNTGRVQDIEIAARNWDIERVNVPLRPSGTSEEWWQRREPEWLAIKAAREQETGAQGWRQSFVWPVTGRISGRFGRQRIYQGEPGSYHSGLDIAPGNGVPFVSPADGVVVLARTGFSLEGGIVIVDHGAGLNSAFIHLSRLAVSEGDAIRQGQVLGNVGSSGRATGPHLHWSLVWQDKRLDPLLFLPPMP